MQDEKLIINRCLENGMDLNYYDTSRKVAGDRWLVGLKCEVFVPVLTSYYEQYEKIEPELLEQLKAVLGEVISFSTSKDRNFVPEEDKEQVLNELIDQADSTVFSYLNNPRFPEKMFMRQIEETRQKLVAEKTMYSLTNHDSQQEEDEGPADFSFCFKD